MFNIYIPHIIIDNENLTATQKIIYGYLVSISKGKEYITITNRELTEKFNLTKRTIVTAINNLEKEQLIDRKIIKDERGQVIERRIKVLIL